MEPRRRPIDPRPSSLALLRQAHPFPDPRRAPSDSPLAYGGDLSAGRLLSAYSQGIFPWYAEDLPILWWSPDPRFVLLPGELRVPRKLRQTIRRDAWELTSDTAFEHVIRACAAARRPGEEGTWITPEMVDAYVHLHELGVAHSIEAWQEGQLVGGLYGVALGAAFFGESMFHEVANASKVAFVRLVEMLVERGFSLLDCQQRTPHLEALGGREIPRREFLDRLADAIDGPARAWPSTST